MCRAAELARQKARRDEAYGARQAQKLELEKLELERGYSDEDMHNAKPLVALVGYGGRTAAMVRAGIEVSEREEQCMRQLVLAGELFEIEVTTIVADRKKVALAFDDALKDATLLASFERKRASVIEANKKADAKTAIRKAAWEAREKAREAKEAREIEREEAWA